MKERDVYVIKEAHGGVRVKNTSLITRKKIDSIFLPQQTNEQISGESNNREGAAPRQPKEI